MRHNESHGIWIAALVGSAIFTACANQAANQPPQQAQLARAVATPDRPGPPEPLSAPARAILKSRMASHARDMGDLVSAIMILDYKSIGEGADRIAGDTNLSRPLTHDATELNAALPEKFFERQDELRAQAKALAQAARELNPYRVAEVYGHVSEACVRCHADFRPGEPARAPSP